MSEIFWFGTLGCEIFWLGAFGVLLLIEILTLGLTTIWFAVGALGFSSGPCAGAADDSDCCIYRCFCGNACIYPSDNDKIPE